MASPAIAPLALVTLDEAKRHLRIDAAPQSPPSLEEQEVASKIL